MTRSASATIPAPPPADSEQQLAAPEAAGAPVAAVDPPAAHKDALERLIKLGVVERDCPTCEAQLIPVILEHGEPPFAPQHRASRMCRSGKRPHCTCSACF